jgi:uncharacterized repeat protein (TIGR01451 family)
MAISTDYSRRQMAACNQKQLTLSAFLFMLLVVCITPVQTVASEATQCANAKNDSDPDTCELWVNGNINQSKANYFEGEAIPYRVVIDPAVIGHEYEITIGWDAVESGKNALDYLATYNQDVTAADPCSGDSLCTLAPPSSTAAIPADTRMQRGRDDIDGNDDDISQTPGEFTVWGGNIVSVGGYNYPTDFSYAGTHELTITLRIEATADNVVLAWGGHMASRLDWGIANGVVNLRGSPFHMRASGSEFDADGYVGSISGIQGDLVLSTSAVIFPSYLNITKETDRSSTDNFAFMSDGSAEGVLDGAFSLQGGQSIKLTVSGNSSAYVEEDLTLPEMLDIYGEPLWELDNVVCTDSENVAVPFGRSGDRIDIAVGEALLIDCYFRNIFVGLPKLELVKKVIPASDTCDTVDFDGTDNESLDVASGDSVRYCYRVQNAGNDIAYDLGMFDDGGNLGPGSGFLLQLLGGDLVHIGKDGMIADLDAAGNTFSEEIIEISLPVGESVTNTATVNAIDFIDMPVSDTDTATVNVTWSQGCTLGGGVSKTGNCADATPVLNVIEGTALTWCADVCMDGGNSDLLDATIALKDAGGTLQSASHQTLAAADCNTWSFAETAGSSSHARNLSASGVDAYGNSIGCNDNATANVYDPNIALDKKISLDSRCGGDVDFTEVYYGDDVWFCFSITNLGDEHLVDARLVDSLLGLDVPVGDLAAGGRSWTSSAYGPYTVTGDIHNTARATAIGGLTGVSVRHDDSADVNMMFADVRVEKTGTAKLNAKEFVPGDEILVSYSIKVTNDGNVPAENVVLTDMLPGAEWVNYLSDDAGCTYDSFQYSLSCELGDIGIGDEHAVTINITVALIQPAPIFGIFENLACAEVMGERTPDINLDNNCDTHDTRIVPGATRTIGFWQNHPDHLGQCLALEENTLELERALDGSCGSGTLTTVNGINLGYVQIADEACDDELDARVSTELTGNGKGHAKGLTDPVSRADEDSDIETALELGLGVLKAVPSHWEDGTRRSQLDAARTTAGRQVLATLCNVTLLDALRPAFLDTYIEVLLGDDIDAILALSGDSDLYNNSGDDEPIGIPGSADPFANNDDPSDPSD